LPPAAKIKENDMTSPASGAPGAAALTADLSMNDNEIQNRMFGEPGLPAPAPAPAPDGVPGVTPGDAAGQRLRACFAATDGDPLGSAFPRKLAIHAGLGGAPVEEERRADLLGHLLSRPRTGKTAAYVHVPFCETHCLYCGFYTKAYGPGESARYTDALLRELDMWAHAPAQNEGPVHAVYIGGGTPTALEAPDLTRLLRGIGAALSLANDCEITVEGRIHNFGPDKMEACLAGGANRFSLGVQTFDTELRRRDRKSVV
jgi:oxygen-independent coproporphyrinogen-3 oxidase